MAAPCFSAWVEHPRQTGALLLIGSSEMFKNEHLLVPGFHHDQFLLNAVAYNAYGAELGTLQARRPTPRGFPFQSAEAKRLWRVFVVGAGPLLFFGLCPLSPHEASVIRLLLRTGGLAGPARPRGKYATRTPARCAPHRRDFAPLGTRAGLSYRSD